eukprot:gene1426-12045_t
MSSFIETFIKRNSKEESEEHSEEESIEVEIKNEESKKLITKEGFLLYRDTSCRCELSENRLNVHAPNKQILVDMKSIFAIHIELTVILIFCFDIKKHQKYLLRLDAQDKKVANEWLFSLQRNVFGLTKEISKRRILFFLNPVAGVKKAEENFFKISKPILDVAHISYETYVSKSKGDITNYVKKVDMSEFDEFCAVGGDGTLFEIIQGLMTRKNWESSVKKPLSIIPSGTGNGIAHSFGATSVELGSFIVARGYYRPVDCNSVFTNGKRVYCLGAVTWGLIAELQKETETMRSMGPRRFDIGAVKRILQKETFEGVLQYVNEKYPMSDDVKKNIYETPIQIEEVSQGSYFNSGPPIPALEKYFFDEVLNVTGKTSYLPEVEDIPKDVTTETDSMVLFCASNVTHISSTYKVAPKAHFSDGCIDIVTIDKNIGMMKMFYSFINDFATGEYVENVKEHVKYRKVKTFCLKAKSGTIVCDGEILGTCPMVLCENHKGMLKVLCL